MKEKLKNFLNGVSIGLGISIGASVILITLLSIDSYFLAKSKEERSIRIEFPQNIEIIEHMPDLNAPTFLIKGQLINNTNEQWKHLSIVANIKIGDAQIGIFSETIFNVKPKSTRDFVINCNTISAKGLPEGINYTYTLSISDGAYERI